MQVAQDALLLQDMEREETLAQQQVLIGQFTAGSLSRAGSGVDSIKRFGKQPWYRLIMEAMPHAPTVACPTRCSMSSETARVGKDTPDCPTSSNPCVHGTLTHAFACEV